MLAQYGFQVISKKTGEKGKVRVTAYSPIEAYSKVLEKYKATHEVQKFPFVARKPHATPVEIDATRE